MATISKFVETISYFSNMLQKIENQTNTVIANVDRMQKLMGRPMKFRIDASEVQQQMSSIQKIIQNVRINITINASEVVKKAQILKTLIENQLKSMQASIRIDLSSSLYVMFANLQGLVNRFLTSTRQLQGIASDQVALQRQIVNMQQQISQSPSQTNNATQPAGNSNSGLLSKAKGIFSKFMSLEDIGVAINISDDYVNTLASIDLINDKTQTTAELQDKIFKAADSAGVSYQDMAGVIVRMGTAASDSFTSNDEMIDFTELMQKSFRVGGASTIEQEAGMEHITQIMSRGELQAGDFQSMISSAPVLAEAIVKFTGKSKSELIEMSAEDAISTDIIKGAVFTMADEINEKFEAIPLTFGNVFTQLKDHALQQSGPIIVRINEMLNSDTGKKFVAGLQGAISLIAMAVDGLLNAITTIYSFISSNWSMIAPIIGGIVAAFALYKGALVAIATWKGIVTAALWVLTAAQIGLNAAMMANPLMWIIIAIVALISLIFVVIAAINHFTGSTISAVGIIIGAFAVLGAFIWNTVIGVLNAIIQNAWTYFVEPWIGIIEWILNVFNGGFNSFGEAVANLLGQIISWFLSLGKIATKIIDAIFGTNWTAGLEDLQDKVLGWGKSENAITLSRDVPIPTIDSRIEYGDAWDKGYGFGEGLNFDSITNLFKQEQKEEKDYTGYLNERSFTPIGSNQPQNIDKVDQVDQVDRINNTVDISSEDLKIMRELAEMKSIQNYVTLQPQLSFGDTHVKQEGRSIDEIVSNISLLLSEEIASSTKGVFA